MMTPYAAAKGIPAPRLAVLGSGSLIILGGLSVLLGVRPTWGVLLLTAFLVPTSFLMHNYWAASDPAVRQMDMTNFKKNIALLGAARIPRRRPRRRRRRRPPSARRPAAEAEGASGLRHLTARRLDAVGAGGRPGAARAALAPRRAVPGRPRGGGRGRSDAPARVLLRGGGRRRVEDDERRRDLEQRQRRQVRNRVGGRHRSSAVRPQRDLRGRGRSRLARGPHVRGRDVALDRRRRHVAASGPRGHAAYRRGARASQEPGSRVRRGDGPRLRTQSHARRVPLRGRRHHVAEGAVRGRLDRRDRSGARPREPADLVRGAVEDPALPVGVLGRRWEERPVEEHGRRRQLERHHRERRPGAGAARPGRHHRVGRHVLWIDPRDTKRMIEGNDGGATVSFDGGATWSTVYNQPTAQFYHVATDDQFPYRIYGAQQDNSTVSIASRSDDGAITMRDWYPLGGGESGYIAPQPGDATIVYAGTYMGTLTRYDHRTAQARDVSVWLNNYDGYAAADVPYRFQWTFPIVFSPHAKNTLYATAQKVFKTTDGGGSWQAISPDLTLHDPATLGPVGGLITRDMTGTEWYATVFTFAESPVKAGVLWAGSDDGLVHVSQDGGGATWQDATPKGLAQFTRMSVLEPSHFAAAAAYLAANRYQQDDFQPYLFTTTDHRTTWTRITTGIPAGAYTRVIREDPVRRGLLFAGTETGIYVSFDDGARWQSLQLNLPRSSVRDIAIHESDLIVATHGRAFWVLDAISPLRQLSDQVPGASAHPFTPEPAVRFAGGRAARAAR